MWGWLQKLSGQFLSLQSNGERAFKAKALGYYVQAIQGTRIAYLVHLANQAIVLVATISFFGCLLYLINNYNTFTWYAAEFLPFAVLLLLSVFYFVLLSNEKLWLKAFKVPQLLHEINNNFARPAPVFNEPKYEPQYEQQSEEQELSELKHIINDLIEKKMHQTETKKDKESIWQ